MQVFRGLSSPALRAGGPSAVTVGNFDGVHRGHQAMLALLHNEARHRGLASTVLSFEPHPRDFFAARAGRADAAPSRIATLRDKLGELERCGIDRAVVLRFDERFAAQSPEAFIRDVLVHGLQARYVLVGDDFRFGARRAGDYAMLDAAGEVHSFDVARMNSYEVHGLRVSSSAVREALLRGDMALAASLLGRPYAVSGRVLHGRKLGRTLGAGPAGDDGFRTLNLRFPHPRPAAQGIFVARVHGLEHGLEDGLEHGHEHGHEHGPADHAIDGVASLGVRPTVEDGGRMLLEVHCLAWPEALGAEGGYRRNVKVELLHKLHDERHYPTLDALREGIAQDVRDARDWFALGPRG